MSSQAPSAFDTFRREEAKGDIFEDGDAALILKANGQVQVLTVGIDVKEFPENVEDLTDQQQAFLENGQRLFALSVAASNPIIMNMLMNMAADPAIVDMNQVQQFANPN